MKIHFQGFFITTNRERKRYFKIILDILMTMWYVINTKAERQLYFNNKDEMNFTIKHRGGIMIKD